MLVINFTRLDKSGRVRLPRECKWKEVFLLWDTDLEAVIVSPSGEHNGRGVDDKGRVTLPPAFREMLGEGKLTISYREGGDFVIARCKS